MRWMFRSWDREVFVTDWRSLSRCERWDGSMWIERGLRYKEDKRLVLKSLSGRQGRQVQGTRWQGVGL